MGALYEDSNATGVSNGTTASTDNSNEDAGAAYVFLRTGTTWAQEAFLKAPNPDAQDDFGYSVAISGDTIVVGAIGEDSDATGVTNGTTASTNNSKSAAGAAYVFLFSSAVSTLSDLTLTSATLNPTFASGTTTYTSSVANGVSSLTVTPTSTSSVATIQYRVGANAYAAVTSGAASGSMALAVGANTVDVEVTAEDGTTVTTYTVTVTRAASSDLTSPSTPSLSATPRTAAALSGTGVPLSLSWTAATDVGSGVAGYEVERSVNGGSWAAVGAYSVRSAAVIAASSGTVRYRVRAVDGAANWGGWAYTPTLSPRLVQQSRSAVKYGGTWYGASSSSYSGNSAKYAKVAGRTATYTFTGRSIAVVTTKAPTRGKVKVYVNGVYVAKVDLYRSSTQYRALVWQKTWSTSRTRTIKLVVVGTAGRPRIDLDAFVVVK